MTLLAASLGLPCEGTPCARALPEQHDDAPTPAPRAVAKPRGKKPASARLQPRGRYAPLITADIAAALAEHPALLSLSDAMLARDVCRRYAGIGKVTARRAIATARRCVAVDSASRGAAS